MELIKILVIVENVPKFYLEILKEDTIKHIQNFFKKKYADYNIKFYINKNKEIPVISYFGNLNLQSISNKIENPSIELKKKVGNGKIRIGQQMKGRSYPSYEKYEIIPAWSRGKGEWKLLSPFYLKFPDKVIFENFYQSFKVWEIVNKQNGKNWKWKEETHIDENGNPNKNWFTWHEKLMNHQLPVRRPNGKAIPLYSFWENKKLGIVEARENIYIPYLKKLFRQSDIYYKLLDKIKNGINILIVEPDGPFLDVYPNGLEVNPQLLKDLIKVTNYSKEGYPEKYRPYGHSYVLATCLFEDSE
jgi:hypothetical protein